MLAATRPRTESSMCSGTCAAAAVADRPACTCTPRPHIWFFIVAAVVKSVESDFYIHPKP